MRLTPRILFLLIWLPFFAQSQDSVINVSRIDGYKKISRLLQVYQPKDTSEDINRVPFTAYTSNGHTGITQRNYNETRWYLFTLRNDTDDSTVTVYFYPGKLVKTTIFMFDSAQRKWIYLPDREAFSSISLSSKIALAPLELRQGHSYSFLLQPELHYYNWTQWRPTIAMHSAVNDLILQEFIRPNYTYSILTILMAGMMFMLLAYSALKFYLNRRSEYLHNALFGTVFLAYFAVLFVNNYYYQLWWHRNSYFLQNWLQAVGYSFEIIFIVRFLDLRSIHFGLFQLLRSVIIALGFYCVLLPFISFSDNLFPFTSVLVTLVNVCLLLVAIYTTLVLRPWNRRYSKYLGLGLISIIAIAILIFLQQTVLRDKQYLVQKIGGWVIIYHFGVLCNLFFFRLGLGQKERREELKNLDDIEKLKLENEKKELEKVLAIASSRVDERNRIAKEIHDDIGSGLTSIRLLSEIALVKKENRDELNKISWNANELVNNLNEIIWSINSKNDTIPNLLAYIRSHMVDYLEPYNIRLSINLPAEIPNIELSGEKRRNIFMVVKECFTNIAKHANATSVNFTVQLRDQLIFTIKDNGKGFDDNDVLPFKNGIRNMKERMEHIGGEIDIYSNNGTTITIKVPLNGSNGNL